jgi:hypothetical protein
MTNLPVTTLPPGKAVFDLPPAPRSPMREILAWQPQDQNAAQVRLPLIAPIVTPPCQLPATLRLEKPAVSYNGDRITIDGPMDDGTYTLEFETAHGDSLAISVPGSEATIAVLEHFQELIPYGVVVPDVRTE